MYLCVTSLFSPCRPALQFPERVLGPTAHRGQAVMPALSHSLRAQQLTIPLTPLSPVLKMFHPPRSPSPPACRRLPITRGTDALHFLGVNLTAARGVTPLPAWAWAPGACPVLLWAPQSLPLASPHGLPSYTPLTCWTHTITLRGATGHPGQTEVPHLCPWIIPCPARCHEISDFTNLVGGVTISQPAATMFIGVKQNMSK